MLKTRAMADGKISSLVLRFSLTTLAALFFSALYNIVDTLFVSRGVGDNAMGGVSLVFPFMIIQSAVAQTVGGGAASIVSRHLGRKNTAEAGEVTLNAMAVFYISAVLVSAIGFLFMNPILGFLGATEEILPYARQYFVIVLAGNVFSTGFSSIIRAEGRMTYALLIWLIPTAVNIILDAVFIFGLGMGVRGAALGTVLCQFTSFVMSMAFFKKMSCQSFKGARLHIKTISEIMGIGVPTLIQMGSLSVITMLLNKILSTSGGTLGVNTFAYVSKIITFGLVPFNAVTQAISPIIGYNHGAGNRERVGKTVSFSASVCVIYAVPALILTLFISDRLIGIFTDNTELILSGSYGLKTIAAALPFVPFPLLFGAYFQAIGKKLPAFLLNISILAFLFPCAALFSGFWGMNGVWWAFLPACAGAAVFSAISMIIDNRKSHNRKHNFSTGKT